MEQIQKISMGQLHITINSQGDKVTYSFDGDLDEKFDHKKIPRMTHRIVRFNLGGVGHINSVGVREWVFLIRQFDSAEEVHLEECSVTMMDQLNVVPQMLGTAHVDSFYAPYYCPQCSEEATCLVQCESYKDWLVKKQAPPMAHHCGTTMEFDALEDCYFHQVGRLFTT